jgi:chromate transporter
MIQRYLELAKLFLKVGTVSFGGPAAHLAVMEHEVVQRRGWLTHEQFLDLIGVSTLIPGPNSTELAAFIGHHRAGRLGSLVAGVSFVVPAALITSAFAWSYVRYGSLPQAAPLLYGIPSAVVAILVVALWRLGKKPLSTWQTALVGLGVAAASLAGLDSVLTFLAGSALGIVLIACTRRCPSPPAATAGGLIAGSVSAAGATQAKAAGATAAATGTLVAGNVVAGNVVAGNAAAGASVSLAKLALFFLKVGAVLYGSGYVLVAYLQSGLVDQRHWLTQQQLLDAVAVGQFTPGPLLSTAAFIGYLLGEQAGVGGLAGAGVATVAIFAPSFAFVMLTAPWIARLRKLRGTAVVLDAVSAASIGLMFAVTVNMAVDLATGRSMRYALTTAPAVNVVAILDHGPRILIALAALAVALRWKPAAAWLVLGSILAGLVLYRW